MIPFADWLQDIKNDEIATIPSDINKEAQANLWTFSLAKEQAASSSVDEWETFIRTIVDEKKEELTSRGYKQGAYTFYCWHDAQAAQFRFSVVSSSHEILPFGSAITMSPDLQRIISAFISSQHHEGIPWEELETSFNEEPKVFPPVEVWAVPIP